MAMSIKELETYDKRPGGLVGAVCACDCKVALIGMQDEKRSILMG